MALKTKAHLAVLAANFFFGVNYIAVKYNVPSHILPLGLNVVRIVSSVILLWLLFLFKPGKAGIDKKDIPRFIICALSGVAINQMLFIRGLSLTTAIHASLLALVTPIFIIFIAAWLLKERITGFKIAGLISGFAGAAILISIKDTSQTGSNIFFGDILIIINAVSYAFYLVLVRPLMQRYSPIHVIRWVFTFGSIIILLFGWNDLAVTNWNNFEPMNWAALAFVAVCATFFAYLFNIYGVSVIGASATGTYIYTQPVFAALIAIFFTGEHLDWIKLLCAALIFGGVYIANNTRKTT